MAIRNQHWYDLNSARDYPLDAEATCVDDSGNRLPSHYIADLNLKFPRVAARLAYLGGITVSPNIVTVVILGAASEDDTQPVPLATISLSRPVEIFRQYPLDGAYPGVGGWIAFGPGVDGDMLTARFATAAQSLLTPRAARSYELLPVKDVGKLGVTGPLTGVVALEAGTDIEIVREGRVIPGHTPEPWQAMNDPDGNPGRECVVIRLKNTSSNTALSRNVFDIYRSPCLGTPESETCGDPQPIQFLGPVQPDCCGNITIKFRGCASVSAIAASATHHTDGSITSVSSSNGVIIDCGLGLSEACITAPYLPDAEGNLPNDYSDLCSLSVSAAVSYSEDLLAELSWSFSFPMEDIVPPAFSFSWGDDSVSFAYEIKDAAVYSDEFTSLAAWTLLAGYFAQAPLSSNVLSSGTAFSTHFTNSAAGINVAVCDDPTTRNFHFRRVCTVVRVDQGDPGSAHNAAVLAVVRPTSEDLTEFTAFAAEIDWDAFREGEKLFRIARYDGHQWHTLASTPVPQLALGHLYRVSLSVFPHGIDGGWLIASLSNIEGAAPVSISLGPLAVANVGQDDGTTYCGLHTKQSRADFLWFGVEAV